MSYDPLIPAANDVLSQSQVDIQTNFAQIGALFGSNANADHYAFDDATAALRAFHKQVTFPLPVGAAPTPTNPKGVLYPLADPNDTSQRTQMYFKNGSTTHQITNRFSDANTPGYVTIGGGKNNIILMWGVEATPTSGNYAVVFPTMTNYAGSPVGFPNTCFNVQLTREASSSATAGQVVIDLSSITTTGFTLRVSASLTGSLTYWFAIGN